MYDGFVLACMPRATDLPLPDMGWPVFVELFLPKMLQWRFFDAVPFKKI